MRNRYNMPKKPKYFCTPNNDMINFNKGTIYDFRESMGDRVRVQGYNGWIEYFDQREFHRLFIVDMAFVLKVVIAENKEKGGRA